MFSWWVLVAIVPIFLIGYYLGSWRGKRELAEYLETAQEAIEANKQRGLFEED